MLTLHVAWDGEYGWDRESNRSLYLMDENERAVLYACHFSPVEAEGTIAALEAKGIAIVRHTLPSRVPETTPALTDLGFDL